MSLLQNYNLISTLFKNILLLYIQIKMQQYMHHHHPTQELHSVTKQQNMSSSPYLFTILILHNILMLYHVEQIVHFLDDHKFKCHSFLDNAPRGALSKREFHLLPHIGFEVIGGMKLQSCQVFPFSIVVHMENVERI